MEKEIGIKCGVLAVIVREPINGRMHGKQHKTNKYEFQIRCVL